MTPFPTPVFSTALNCPTGGADASFKFALANAAGNQIRANRVLARHSEFEGYLNERYAELFPIDKSDNTHR